jgi:hypothetical protein
MRTFFVALGVAAALTGSAYGAEVAFRKTKMVDHKEKEVKVELVFDPDTKVLMVRGPESVVAEIPYDAIDKVSYELSKHRRVKQGALIMAASLGAGAVVMMTKAKKHWLYVDHHKDGHPQTLTLQLDKKEYEEALAAAEAQTGKTVERLLPEKAEKEKKKTE